MLKLLSWNMRCTSSGNVRLSRCWRRGYTTASSRATHSVSLLFRPTLYVVSYHRRQNIQGFVLFYHLGVGGHIRPGTFWDAANSGSETHTCHSFHLSNRYICGKNVSDKTWFSSPWFLLFTIFFLNSKYFASYTGDVCKFTEAITKKCLLFVQI